jgi:hypothetical protein
VETFTKIGISHGIDFAGFSQVQVRKDRNLGILLSAVFFLAGIYLLYESTAHSQWHKDFYVIAGATISAIGLITGYWAIRRHLFIRRLEQHVRGDQQIESR